MLWPPTTGKPSPYDQSAYDYPGDKLKEAWPRLTRGFGDYPYPDADWVVNMATAHPDALEKTVKAGTGFTGKAGRGRAICGAPAGCLAPAVPRRLRQGQGAGTGPWESAARYRRCSPRCSTPCSWLPDQAEKQRLLEEVIDYTEQAGPLVKADIVAQFGSVYAKARLAEELSVPVVLKRGYTSEIPKELDALLARQPNQPFALAPYGGYEAGVIRKVGKLVGKMTYGVSADKMEQYFARSFRQANDLPIGHYEYANALTYVYGDDERRRPSPN